MQRPMDAGDYDMALRPESPWATEELVLKALSWEPRFLEIPKDGAHASLKSQSDHGFPPQEIDQQHGRHPILDCKKLSGTAETAWDGI